MSDKKIKHKSELICTKRNLQNQSQKADRVVYIECFDSKEEAMKREKKLKSSRGRNFIRNYISQHITDNPTDSYPPAD